MPTKPKIRLLVADDQEMVRSGVKALLADTEIEASLTDREGEVLGQMAQGLTNKQIAVALNISDETVKEHVQNILQKIGLADRTQAAVWAVRNNLV